MKKYKLLIYLIFGIAFISALSACNNNDIKYDKNGRVIEREVYDASIGSTEVIVYKYDENGNKIEETSTWDDKSGDKNKFDTKGRVIEDYTIANGITQLNETYKYDEWDNAIEDTKYDNIINVGRVESRTLSKYSGKNKIAEENVYDWKGRLLKYSYYDNNGKIIKQKVYNEKSDLIKEINNDLKSISIETIEYNEDGSIKEKSIKTTTYNNPQ